MRFLLSNDDGYFAPGIEALAAGLATLGTVTVVAPERDRSGASNSLTLDRPLMLRRAPNGFHFVNGTPTDCVHLAVTGMLDQQPDMVISGINHGANMGDDTVYSGTVAAATEGFLLGVPSLAVSLAAKPGEHLDTAVQVTLDIVRRMMDRPFTEPTCSTSTCRTGRSTSCGARLPPVWAGVTMPSRWSKASTRVVTWFTGSAPPARRRTPGKAPTFMPCEKGLSQSPRCRST